jgi:signal transduction histidine kinase/ActR/RegA family two-component response regulator
MIARQAIRSAARQTDTDLGASNHPSPTGEPNPMACERDPMTPSSTNQMTIVVAEQLFRSWPLSVFNLLAAVAVSFILRGAVADAFLWAWTAIFALYASVRLIMWFPGRRQSLDLARARRVTVQTQSGAAASAAVWGIGSAYLLLHADGTQQSLLILALLGLAMTAVFNFAFHLPTFITFLLLTLLPTVPALAVQPVQANRLFAPGVILFIVVLGALARGFNVMVRRSLRLRFENVALIEQLTRQRKVAEEANVAKSRFLAAASHDLRQPMHAFALYLGALSTLSLTAPAQDLSDKLHQCMKGMDGLFRALLDVSQLDAGAVQPHIESFDIAQVMERLRLEFEPQAQSKGLELRVLQGRASGAMVVGDVTLTERILRNLLSNAVRYTERGRVVVILRRRGARLQIAVCDTGIGIALSDQPRIFDEFLQLGNPQRDQANGLGLGLAIVQRLARLMEIALTLQSHPGRGSIFTIHLPLAPTGSDPAPHAPRAAQAGSRGLAGLLVMIIDDEQSILDATRHLLQAWGCTVATAASGAEAARSLCALARPPDLLLCDYRLPGDENGWEVVEALRQECSQDIPAVLITGDTEPRRLVALKASGLAVLHKPLDAEKLRQAIAQAVRPHPTTTCGR